MDICDISRQYSMWHGIQAWTATNAAGIAANLPNLVCSDGGSAYGWGNPTGSQCVNIPDSCWVKNWNMTGCYLKGSIGPYGSVIGEQASHCTMTNCYNATGSALNHSDLFGNVVSGTFPGGHPANSVFTVDWSGATTSYTPSPYDP
jgi:hypothetical protein